MYYNYSKKKNRKKCLKREHKWWFKYGDFSFWEKYHLLCSNIVPERKETTINFHAKKRRKISERNGSLQKASLLYSNTIAQYKKGQQSKKDCFYGLHAALCDSSSQPLQAKLGTELGTTTRSAIVLQDITYLYAFQYSVLDDKHNPALIKSLRRSLKSS